MLQSVLRSLLRTRLTLVADLPLVREEGVAYAQAALVSHLETELRPGTNVVQSNGTVETRGLWFLTLHSAPSSVLAEIDRVADAIANAYEPGRTLIDDAQSHWVELLTLDPGALRIYPTGWGYRRITVGYTASAFRTSLQSA